MKLLNFLPYVILLLLAATLVLTSVILVSIANSDVQIITLGLIIVITTVASMVALTFYVMISKRR